jgi:hypothetical protein
MPQLTSTELRRACVSVGGLWSQAEMRRLFKDRRIESWARRSDFPQTVWMSGQIKLWAGWEVWFWLDQHDHYWEARILKDRLEFVRRNRKEPPR